MTTRVQKYNTHTHAHSPRPLNKPANYALCIKCLKFNTGATTQTPVVMEKVPLNLLILDPRGAKRLYILYEYSC